LGVSDDLLVFNEGKEKVTHFTVYGYDDVGNPLTVKPYCFFKMMAAKFIYQKRDYV
jgi:hypothetical protein